MRYAVILVLLVVAGLELACSPAALQRAEDGTTSLATPVGTITHSGPKPAWVPNPAPTINNFYGCPAVDAGGDR